MLDTVATSSKPITAAVFKISCSMLYSISPLPRWLTLTHHGTMIHRKKPSNFRVDPIVIERFFNKLKDFRRIATRYGNRPKLPRSIPTRRNPSLDEV